MARAVVIDGKALAQSVRRAVGAGVARFISERGFTPGLAVVLVGDNPASRVYVRNKASATREVGMRSIECTLPADISQEGLLDAVRDLNRRGDVHGILVQLPLPRHIDPTTVIEAIDPVKDVDGFHPLNLGRMALGLKGLVPCTPRACLRLIKTHCSDLAGLRAVVIGRSNIVGKPMALLLLAENCTVTVAHSRTLDLATVVRGADVVVAAVGKPEMVRGDWLKEGAIVIDVGINRVAGASGRHRLVGDVAFAEAAAVAGALTPVPGGVGPMTIACLLENALEAAQGQSAHG